MSPRSIEQINTLKAEKRAVIIKAGMKLFAKEGYLATSIAMIAKEAGISKGLIYTYFKGKEDLLRSIVIDTMEDMFAITFNVLSECPTDQEFEVMIEANFDWLVKNREFLKIYFSIILQSSVLSVFEKEIKENAMLVFFRISKFFENKKYANPMVETRYLAALLDGVFMNYIVEPKAFPLCEIKQKIIFQYIK